jgi:hypothetical protein
VIEQPSDRFANALTLSYAVSVKSTTPLQQQLVSKGATKFKPHLVTENGVEEDRFGYRFA